MMPPNFKKNYGIAQHKWNSCMTFECNLHRSFTPFLYVCIDPSMMWQNIL